MRSQHLHTHLPRMWRSTVNTPGQYPVRAGDTLRSIAQAAYGDADLWYEIASANGVANDSELRVGQVLNTPTKVGGIHNSASTFAPYDPSRVVGSTEPLQLTKGAGYPQCQEQFREMILFNFQLLFRATSWDFSCRCKKVIDKKFPSRKIEMR